MSWRDREFKYHGVATHADPAAFARRMKARKREADIAAKAREDERAEKVRTLPPRVRKASS